jgi:hypothetical protein
VSKKNPSFRVGLVIGVLAGVLVTGTLAHSGMGKKAWGSFGRWFKAGYVLGFTDAVRLAKQTSPGSYMDTTYKLPNKAPWPKWVDEIDRMYEDPKHDKLDVGSVMILVAPILTEEYGPEPGSDPLAGLQKLKEAIKASKAAAAKDDGAAPDGDPAADLESDAPDADPAVD